jgi:shikimate 5-dehydrogenase
MTTISIIGSGNMATAIGTRATKHGHTIELMSRNTAKAGVARCRKGAWMSTAVAFPSPSQRSGPGGNPPSDDRDSTVEATARR